MSSIFPSRWIRNSAVKFPTSWSHHFNPPFSPKSWWWWWRLIDWLIANCVDSGAMLSHVASFSHPFQIPSYLPAYLPACFLSACLLLPPALPCVYLYIDIDAYACGYDEVTVAQCDTIGTHGSLEGVARSHLWTLGVHLNGLEGFDFWCWLRCWRPRGFCVVIMCFMWKVPCQGGCVWAVTHLTVRMCNQDQAANPPGSWSLLGLAYWMWGLIQTQNQNHHSWIWEIIQRMHVHPRKYKNNHFRLDDWQ